VCSDHRAEAHEALSAEEVRYMKGRPKAGSLESLGEAIYGDLVTCHDEDKNEVSFVARRARFRFPIVEPTRNAITLGYRSAPRFAYVARDDLAPVFLAPPRG